MIAEETRALDSLRPHSLNYNHHSAEQIQRLQASLVAFGQVRPIVIRADGTILAGHGVYMAARESGYTSLRCSVVPDDWTEERAIAYLVADNETRRGAQPDDLVLAELIEMTRGEVGLEALGFDDGALDALLAGLGPVDAPEEFAAYDEGIETEYCCPKCNYEWSGKPKCDMLSASVRIKRSDPLMNPPHQS